MTMPTGIQIVQSEQVRYQAYFSPNLILKHLKVELMLTDKRVVVRSPNTIFGLIPLGYLERSAPLDKVAEVAAGESVSTRKLVYGGLAALFGLLTFVSTGIGIGGAALSLLIGLCAWGFAAYCFLTAHVIGISFRNCGAGVLSAPASRSERPQVEQARAHIHHILFN